MLTGAGVVTIRASQAGDANHLAATPVDRSFTVGMTFDAWRLAVFTPTERANADISGPNASAASDGVSNLAKYALGLDPHAPLPGGWNEVETTQGGWVFVYQRPADRPDLTYAVEASTTLTAWSGDHVVHELESSSNATQTWRAIYAPPQNPPNVFFRLKVTR